MNDNSSYVNFSLGMTNINDGVSYTGNLNMFNSNGNENNNVGGVRPVASVNCGYAINDCIRDNIETNYIHSKCEFR